MRLQKRYPENIFYQAHVGTTLNDLGDLLLKIGDVGEARKVYKQAFKVFTKNSDITSKIKLRSIVSLAIVYLTLGRGEIIPSNR